jgi:hypothetical protein
MAPPEGYDVAEPKLDDPRRLGWHYGRRTNGSVDA